jgi:hypothetical protein
MPIPRQRALGLRGVELRERGLDRTGLFHPVHTSTSPEYEADVDLIKSPPHCKHTHTHTCQTKARAGVGTRQEE